MNAAGDVDHVTIMVAMSFAVVHGPVARAIHTEDLLTSPLSFMIKFTKEWEKRLTLNSTE
ncbi:hypothetical protein [Bdellovibrio sp.]|uniref:hypothetical protein n=1 Tax=Bdellovibrio sp. TaxID=28201 RepID=UPI002F35FBE5